jgi:hypothetical protein
MTVQVAKTGQTNASAVIARQGSDAGLYVSNDTTFVLKTDRLGPPVRQKGSLKPDRMHHLVAPPSKTPIAHSMGAPFIIRTIGFYV